MTIDTSFVIKDTLIEQILKNSEGRYFWDFEEKYILNYYSQLPDKLATLRNISNKKNRIVKESVEKILSNNNIKDIPNIESYLSGDISLLIKYTSSCIISESLIDLANLLVKYYEKYKLIDFDDETIYTIFNSIKEFCSKELYKRDYELLISFINAINLENVKAYLDINEKLEIAIVNSCDKIYDQYPDMKKKDPDNFLCIKDKKLIMQYVLLSMLSNNPIFLSERIIYVYNIFKNLNFSDQFLIDSYKILEMELKKELKPKDYYKVKNFVRSIYTIFSSKIKTTLEQYLYNYSENSKKILLEKINNLDSNKENFIKNDLGKIFKDIFASIICNNYLYIREKIINYYEIMEEISFGNKEIKLIIETIGNNLDIENKLFFLNLIEYDNIQNSKIIFERIENNSIYNKFYKDFCIKNSKYKDIEMNYEVNSLLKSSTIYMLNKNENYLKDELESISSMFNSINIYSKNDFVLTLQESCQSILPSDIYDDYKSYLKAFLSNI